MNNSTYVFGKLKGGYTQYPDDNTKSLFEKCIELSKDPKQIIVRRQENLMYFTFVQFFNRRRTNYIGLCLTFSGLTITDYKRLFCVFEEGVRSLAIEGEILTYKNNEIVAKTNRLEDKGAEVRNLDHYLSFKFGELKDIMIPLPPIAYSVSSCTVKKCNLYNIPSAIMKATSTYGYTIISPGKEDCESQTELEAILNPRPKKQRNKILNIIIEKIKLLCKR